jgi:hypothetical protein
LKLGHFAERGWRGALISGEKANFCTHDLVDLWARCRRVIGRFESELTEQDIETIEAAEAQIVEFGAVDPGSDTFRFAHDRKGRRIKLKLSEIDLDHTRKAMGGLLEFLECAPYHLRYLQDIAAVNLNNEPGKRIY